MKFLNLMLIVLVLSLPVASAASLSGYTYGQDEVQGYSRQTDEVTLVAEVGGVSDVDADQVFYKSISGRQEFDNCVDNTCYLTLEEKTYTNQEQEFTIEFRGVDREEEDISLIPDSRAAKVTSVSVDKTSVGPDSSITFNVTATDDACTGNGCDNKCSGISTIDIYWSSDYLDQIGVYSDDCSVSIQKTFQVSDLTDKTGDVVFTFKAIDGVQNEPDYTKSVVVNVDDSPPTPVTDTYNLISNGEDIQFYSDRINVRFLMDAVEGTVYADLTELGGNSRYLTCNDVECYADFTLDIEGSGEETFTVPVELEDEFGNYETYDLEKDIFIDQVGPEVDDFFLGTGKINGTYAFGSETQTILYLDDDVGFYNANIFLDFSQVNPSYSSVKADYCDATACIFPKVLTTLQGEKTISLSSISRDDLDNEVEEEFSFDVITDLVPPLIVDIPYVGFEGFDSTNSSSSSSGSSSERLSSRGSTSSSSSSSGNVDIDDLGIPTIGSTLIVEAIVNENNNVVAYGNFSAINDEVQFGECEGGVDVDDWEVNVLGVNHDVKVNDGDNPIVCTFEVEVTKSGNIIGQEAEIFFQDVSGNYDSEFIDIPNVYGIIGDENPNYWSHNVSCSPSSLDREVGELIEQIVFCTVTLSPLSDNLQTINSIELDDCESDFLDDAELGNSPSFNPYLKLTFDEDEYEVDSLNVTCSIDVSTMLEYDVVTNLERENITINLGLFNNPYELPDEAIVSEIEDVNEQYNGGMWSMIGTLQSVAEIAGAICKAWDTLQTVGNLMSAVSSKMGDNPAGMAARSASGKVLFGSEKLGMFAEKFCAFINCRAYQENGETKHGTFAPWSDKLFSTLDFGGLASKFTSKDKTNVQGDPSQYLDVKNNMYLSAMTLCVPGIIQNMEKYRQIQCYYGYCLQDVSVENSLPITACEQQKAYMTCKFFVSPLFTAFPIIALFDHVLDLIKNALRDPFVAMGFVLNYYCDSVTEDGSAWSICEITRIINMATNVYSSFTNILGQFNDDSQVDYCELLEESDRSSSSSSGRGSTRS